MFGLSSVVVCCCCWKCLDFYVNGYKRSLAAVVSRKKGEWLESRWAGRREPGHLLGRSRTILSKRLFKWVKECTNSIVCTKSFFHDVTRNLHGLLHYFTERHNVTAQAYPMRFTITHTDKLQVGGALKLMSISGDTDSHIRVAHQNLSHGCSIQVFFDKRVEIISKSQSVPLSMFTGISRVIHSERLIQIYPTSHGVLSCTLD